MSGGGGWGVGFWGMGDEGGGGGGGEGGYQGVVLSSVLQSSPNSSRYLLQKHVVQLNV